MFKVGIYREETEEYGHSVGGRTSLPLCSATQTLINVLKYTPCLVSTQLIVLTYASCVVLEALA